MTLPIELDVAIGIRGQRVAWHFEDMRPISPDGAVALVEAVKDAFLAALGSPTGETQPGSVVSGEGGSASGTSDTDPPEPVVVEVPKPTYNSTRKKGAA